MCRGYFSFATSFDARANNITYPAVACGMLLGAPTQSIDPVLSSALYSGNLTYDRNLYICATGVRASVKDVEFIYNGTGKSLDNLKVLNVKDKTYADERSKPLWASEHSGDFRMRWDPLWGIVDDRYESYGFDEGFYTMRAERMWMATSPHLTGNFGEIEGYDALAAVSGFVRRLGNLYGGLSELSDPDYTGAFDFAMLERFRGLTRSQDTAGQVMSLILNDGLAASLVGTKTAISTRYVPWPASLAVDDPIEGIPAARVMVYERVIRYDIRYAIPAFIVLGLLLIVLLWALLILITSRSTITDLKHVYNQTSAGRLATNLLLAEHAEPKQSSAQWVMGDGSLPLSFGQMAGEEKDYFCVIGTKSGEEITVRDVKGENAALLTVGTLT